MRKRNVLPAWYPAACHSENIYWSVPQWIQALSHRSQLVRAEAAGELDLAQLEAVIQGNANPPSYPTVIPLHVDVEQPNTVLVQWFIAELESARKQAFSPAGSGICQGISKRKSKVKLLSLLEGMGKLNRLHILDWLDLIMWARLSGITLGSVDVLRAV
jgi:hypothetical protein